MERIITSSAVAEWIKRVWGEQWGSQCCSSHVHVGYQNTLRIPPPLFLSLLSAPSATGRKVRMEGCDGGVGGGEGGVVVLKHRLAPEANWRAASVGKWQTTVWLCYTMQGTVTGLRYLFRSGNLQQSSVVAWPCTQTQLQKHSFVSQLWKMWELYQSGVFC